MTRIFVAALAAADLDEIWRHSLSQWGLLRTTAYFESMQATFLRAAEHPGEGRDRSEFIKGMRSMRSGRHVIFYRTMDERAIILRVVHEKRDLRALRFGSDSSG